MKRLASIVVLSVFLFNIVGYYAVFSLLNYENRAIMGRKVQNGSGIHAIRVPKADIANIIYHAEDRELSINREMYDVKSIFDEGEYIVFYCANDKRETKLLAGLDKEAKYNSPQNSTSEKKHDNSSKNPVKDLFIQRNNVPENLSAAVVFGVTVFHFNSYLAAPLPPPPPEFVVA
jgi:hypothetical protein